MFVFLTGVFTALKTVFNPVMLQTASCNFAGLIPFTAAAARTVLVQLWEIECKPDMKTLTLKEKSAFVENLLQTAASNKNIELKLHKKK